MNANQLRPFFRYRGSKLRLAPSYPAPKHTTIVEPFAGSAGYSLRYGAGRRVVLVERWGLLVALWRYLQRVSPFEILRLPVTFETTDDLKVCEEARWLIGFWLNAGGGARPRRTPSEMLGRSRVERIYGKDCSGSFWGTWVRQSIAMQLHMIRDWTVLEGDYTMADSACFGPATWFIDPPYAHGALDSGSRYVHDQRAIRFESLSRWAQTRQGQVIVCEGPGANWLPFSYMKEVSVGPTNRRKSYELVWTTEGRS